MPAEAPERLLQALADQNPWWEEGKVPPDLAKPFPRRDFFPLRDKLAAPEAVAIYGPRQVGKTTLLFQLVQYLIEVEGVPPRSVLYHSLDHPGLGEPGSDTLSEVIEAYARTTLKHPLGRRGERVFLFFDEVSRAPNWSRTLKGWYDLKYRLKFVVSDSSQSLLTAGVSRDLVGRILTQTVLPMKFLDVVAFRGGDRELSKAGLDWRRGVVDAIRTGDPARVGSAFRRVSRALARHRRKLLVELDRYLLLDGYPGIVGIESVREAAARLRNYLDMTFYRDIVRVFDVRNPAGLEELASLLAAETSQRMNYQGLSATLKLKNDTLKDYLAYLESVFLVTRSEFFARSRAKRLRRDKKIYFRNCGLRNALCGDLGDHLLRDPGRLGMVVETVVADHAIRLAFHAGKTPSISYWQDENGREVDVVLETAERAIGIEVKYRSQARGDDTAGLRSFMAAFPGALGIVVTRDRLEVAGGVVYVPLHIFLAVC